MEIGFAGDEGGEELGAPDVAGGAGDVHLVREAGGHVEGVGHECESGHLVGELFAEEEEIGVGGVGGLEVVEDDGGWNPFGFDGGVDFTAKSAVGGVFRSCGRCRAEFVHGEENRVIFIETVAAAMVFIYALEGDVGRIVLD